MSSKCFHCGDTVFGNKYSSDKKEFCCNGCKTVYELIHSSDLNDFYAYESNAGVKPEKVEKHKYEFLDVVELREKFIDFEDDKTIRITIQIPAIHCSSCIYLLENISKLNDGIISSQVNFTQKKSSIIINKEKIKLSELSILLEQIGYRPNFDVETNKKKNNNKILLIKIGIAAFAFGNIMLWTFPEYLGIENGDQKFRNFTSYLSLLISLPVLLYSANEYLISAYKALKFKTINLDVPIALGIVALYAKSLVEIISQNGPGYMDSFAGFILFLLIGKWFQSKTYKSLSFDRDNASYFPVAVLKILNATTTELIDINSLKVGDEIYVRNEEIIPCDSVLLDDSATLDYSFVTGESRAIKKQKSDKIYAGGKLIGNKKRFKISKISSNSYLNELWNQTRTSSEKVPQSDKTSVYFLIAVLFVAFLSALTWYFIDPTRIIDIVVSILIVACPCALALSKPFTNGNIMRGLAKTGLFLKNTEVIDQLNNINTLVFDKTGTLTSGSFSNIQYKGEELSDRELNSILNIVSSSTHPLSKGLSLHLDNSNSIATPIETFKEIPGLGIIAETENAQFKIGSSELVGVQKTESETEVNISINDQYKGRFIFNSAFRPGLKKLFHELDNQFNIHIISGDSDKDAEQLSKLTTKNIKVSFSFSPLDKTNYIVQLQSKGQKVLMIGDGLNDGAALQQADVGIAISENIFQFTPNSMAILEARNLVNLYNSLSFSNKSIIIYRACLIFSVFYNFIGLLFAISGHLSPIVAAILMPLSSISIVLISLILSRFYSKRLEDKFAI